MYVSAVSSCGSVSHSASFAVASLGVGRPAGFSPLKAIRQHVEQVLTAQGHLTLMVDAQPMSAADACTQLQTMSRRGVESDPVWSALINVARAEGGFWVTIALGAALPALTWKCSRPLASGIERSEVEAAAVAAFVDELLAGQLPPTGLLAHLSKAANRAAQRQVDGAARCRLHTCAVERAAGSMCSGPEGAATGHPDFALAALVRERVLTKSEAELIGRHRLEGVTLKQIAEERGWYPMQASRALRRAEARAAATLKEWISRNG